VGMPAEYGDEISHISYLEYVPRVSTMLLRNFGWRLRRQLAGGPGRSVAVAYLLGTLFLVVGLASATVDAEPSLTSGSLLAGLLGTLAGVGLDYNRDTSGTVRIDSDPESID